MTSKTIKAGETIIEKGQALDCFWYISGGSISAQFSGGSILLEKGDIIGICDFNKDSHFLSYQAATDCSLVPYGSPAVLLRTKFFGDHPDNRVRLALSMNRFVRKLLAGYTAAYRSCKELYDFLLSSHTSYRTFCEELHVVIKELPGFEALEPLEESYVPNPWITAHYTGIHNIMLNKAVAPILHENQFIPGYLYRASDDIHTLLERSWVLNDYVENISNLLLNESRLDLFDLYTSLYYRIGMQNPNSPAIAEAIENTCNHAKNQSCISEELVESRIKEYNTQIENMKRLMESSSDGNAADSAMDFDAPSKLMNATDIILEYANCSAEVATDFKNTLSEYKKISDKNSTSQEAMRLRRSLTDSFYKVYTAAFLASLTDNNIPPVMRMFFNFGFVDADLCGMDCAAYLYQNAGHYAGSPEHGIYTVHEWLKTVYNGENEPSINELDMDFEKYVHSLKSEGSVTAEAAAEMLNDNMQKVNFELENMFQRGCKITSGRPSVFCPLLSEHQFIRDPKDALLYPDQIIKQLDDIRSTDYTVFARKSLTVLSEKENIHDFFEVEVMPNIILMPVVGMRGAMWQEIVGRSRLTPARMMLPVFQLEDLEKIMIRMIGEYRWEMCKRVQGARWNDVTEPSLTSLYYDFLQFYRKNPELSTDTKEKIKTGLQKCKQNFKEYFLTDYMTYLLFECKGSPHLVKNARSILFSQCPPAAPVRQRLSTNPIYQDLLEAHGRSVAERCRKLDNLGKKLLSKGEPIPEVMQQEVAFVKR